MLAYNDFEICGIRNQELGVRQEVKLIKQNANLFHVIKLNQTLAQKNSLKTLQKPRKFGAARAILKKMQTLIQVRLDMM